MANVASIDPSVPQKGSVTKTNILGHLIALTYQYASSETKTTEGQTYSDTSPVSECSLINRIYIGS